MPLAGTHLDVGVPLAGTHLDVGVPLAGTHLDVGVPLAGTHLDVGVPLAGTQNPSCCGSAAYNTSSPCTRLNDVHIIPPSEFSKGKRGPP